VESRPFARAVGFETPEIQCEDFVGADFLAQQYKRRIRKIHRRVRILFNERSSKKEVLRLCRFENLHTGRLNEFGKEATCSAFSAWPA
jgi:hypothetical protein